MGLRREGRPWRRCSAVAGAATALVVLPYLAWNQATTGSVMPISGALKVDVFDPTFWWVAPGLAWPLLLAAGALASSAYRGTGAGRTDRDIVVALLAGAALAIAYYVIGAQRLQVDWPWYFVPSALCLAITSAATVRRFVPQQGSRTTLPTRARLVDGLVVAAAMMLVLLAARTGSTKALRFATETAEFGERLAEVVPEGAAIAVVDRPGILAVSSERSIIALDGLTQDLRFQERLVTVGTACTLQERGARHLVTFTPTEDGRVAEPDRPYRLRTSSWLTGQPTGTLMLSPEQRRLTGGEPSLTLWELRPESC